MTGLSLADAFEPRPDRFADPVFSFGLPLRERRELLIRLGKTRAKQALHQADFGPGREVYALTYGQWGVIDWIDALLDYTGPAEEAVVSMWTCAAREVARLGQWVEDSRIQRCRWFVDQSMRNREPAVCRMLQERFGEDAVRSGRNHAKFVTLRAGDWRIVSLGTANLNENWRLEHYHVVDCPEVYRLYLGLVDQLWEIQSPLEVLRHARGRADRILRRKATRSRSTRRRRIRR